MIELVNVTKSYHSGMDGSFTALEEVSLTLEQGKVTVLKGPSGSGKTTLLSLLGCMTRPTSGRIKLKGMDLPFPDPLGSSDGLDISNLPERFQTLIRRKVFGFIFQHYNLIVGMSTLQNVMIPLLPAGEKHSEIRSRADHLLERFELLRHAAAPVERLSGGEQQRVAIARALIGDPRVVIADEPTAHLDSRLSLSFMEIVRDLRSEGKSVIIASHDPIIYESPFTDRIISMRDGRIVASDTPR